jgi:mono/diheme cytochrome c family protein
MLIPFLLAGCIFAAGDDQEAKNLPDGTGKDVVAKVCLSCHGAGNFRQMRKTKDEWTDQVGDMIDYRLPDAELRSGFEDQRQHRAIRRNQASTGPHRQGNAGVRGLPAAERCIQSGGGIG